MNFTKSSKRPKTYTKVTPNIEIPKEQLLELERVGIKTIKTSEQQNSNNIDHSLEQLLELQTIGILSIYPKKRTD